MLHFVTETSVPTLKAPYIRWVSLMYAGILVILVVAQLFNFEKFVPLVESFWLPGGRAGAYLMASLIVIAEVFALPFLIRMKLSPAMCFLSMFMSWLVPALWLYITLWLNVTVNAVANVGYLGTTVELPVGWWAVFFAAALGFLAAWCSWGMWPGKLVGSR